MPPVLSSRSPHLHVSHRALAVATLALAAVATLLIFAEAYDVGAVVGLIAVLVGGWSQMVSDTTAERFESVTGVIVAGLALAVGLANGSGIFT